VARHNGTVSSVARAYPSNRPDQYGASYLPTLRQWSAGPIGTAIRAASPTVFPWVPPNVFLGFASNGSPNGDTAEVAGHAAFHELGLFGVEGGPWDLPAPNDNTSVDNAWWRYHDDPTVRSLLGRSATMVPGAWKMSAGGLDDQVAVGLVALRGHAAGVASGLAPELRWATGPDGFPVEWSPWAIALTFGGWSAGGARMAAHVNPYRALLASVPEADRWTTWYLALARDAMAGRLASAAPQSHSNPAYTAVRTAQKIRAGYDLHLAEGGSSGVWWPPVDAATAWADDVLARAAAGVSLEGLAPEPPKADGLPTAAKAAIASVVGALAVGLAVRFWP